MGIFGNFFSGGPVNGSEGSRGSTQKKIIENNKKIGANQALFLNAGSTQSIGNQFSDFGKPGLVASVNKGFEQTPNNNQTQTQGQIDALTSVFENRRDAIKKRISLPGQSLFLTGK